ncbi:suppressor protein sef1 [Cladophialophora chaetospira]|uniref:Suppressor protein sef1 n=1 Tax=Cladophialophora chaetospira TaxID=386627 RepID=A0AA39CQP1_9EURO|nr:suppressor protein sef1 [Cladophialophora chaetospira]
MPSIEEKRQERIEKLEEQLLEAKQKLEGTPHDAPAPGSRSPEARHRPSVVEEDFSTFQFASFFEDLEPLTLDGITIQPQTTVELFERYYLHHHSRFPILSSPLITFRSSKKWPPLFWSIILVSAKDRQQDSLYARLSQPLKRLVLSPEYLSSQSLEMIQALLLLCTWAGGDDRSWTDLSWTYSGIATHAALQMGLHRPEYANDFIYGSKFDDEIILSRRKAWIACFIENEMASRRIGVPCTAPIDHTILEALSSPTSSIPVKLKQQLQIAYLSYRTNTTLGNSDLSPAGVLLSSISAIHMFEKEFSLMESTSGLLWSPHEEVLFLGSKLNLYIYAITSSNSSTQNGRHSNVDEFIGPALATGIKLIDVAHNAESEISSWSVHTKESLIAATFFLLMLRDSEHPLVDLATTRKAIGQAWNTLHACIVTEHDYLSRTCTTISYLSQNPLKREGNGFALKTKSRMASSIMWDTIRRLKEQFGLEKPAQSLSERLAAASGQTQTTPNGTEMQIYPEDLTLDYGGDLIDWDSLFTELGDFYVPPQFEEL